jgi:hypothetical protein
LDITQESFDALLKWLDPDREVAGQKYETIRAGLIRIYVSHGVSDSEHWADVTMDRVGRKIPDSYVGEKPRYFGGFARNIIHEATDPKEITMDELPERPSEVTKPSDADECLTQCLKFLPHDKRELILDYYVHQGHDKIEGHRLMAEALGITEGALRGRAFQIRNRLEKCVLQCLKNLTNKNGQ